MRTALTILALMMLASIPAASALPPAEAGRGFVDGANHHLGDASFVERYGRAPAASDPEHLRMHAHLVHVRAVLGAQPATRPELEGQRATLLGYLDDYIAAGTTPQNFEVPWRSPVFVDALGRVCAVGYLIERSAGRALVERVAATHLTDFLEDIAVAIPEVGAWIAASGMTLDELASIQPGYIAPVIETWEQWELGKRRPTDGPWLVIADGVTTRGTWLDGQMDGPWTREDTEGHIIGRGELVRGRGTWTSFDARGQKVATGPIKGSYPDGKWQFFHPSGQLAARGNLMRGQRIGAWTFYYDGDGEVPIAKGRFERGGRVSGTWSHYDSDGKVFATTTRSLGEYEMEILGMQLKPAGGLEQAIVEGNVAGDFQRVDGFKFEGARYYMHDDFDGPQLYSADGLALTRQADGSWVAVEGPWNAATKAAAKRGKIFKVRALLVDLRRDQVSETTYDSQPKMPVAATEAARLDRLLAALDGVRAPLPAFAKAYVSEPSDEAEAAEAEAQRRTNRDLARVVASNMAWYVEWPHVDGAFAKVFATLPGHYPPGTVWSLADESQAFGDGVESEGVMVISSSAAPNGERSAVAFR